MCYRYALYDALESLCRGNYIVSAGDSSFFMHLEGVPEIPIIFDRMKRNQWIHRQEITKEMSPLSYWGITPEGFKIYKMGYMWYHALPWWKRSLARTGFFDHLLESKYGK